MSMSWSNCRDCSGSSCNMLQAAQWRRGGGEAVEADEVQEAGSSRREPAGGQLQLPPGFRFYPSDEELVVHYLCKRAASGQPFAVPIIAELDLYKFDPWELPDKALFGEKEWYFFSPRDRKYPNGSRPNRAAGCGYWKATGTDKPISKQHMKVGVKKALVFYKGRPPKGLKTNWIMHEYRLADSAAQAATRKGSIRLDDWVLCRIYKKLPSATRLAMQKEEEAASCNDELDDPPLMQEVDDDSNLGMMMSCTTTDHPIQATHDVDFARTLPHQYQSSSCSIQVAGSRELQEGILNERFIKPPQMCIYASNTFSSHASNTNTTYNCYNSQNDFHSHSHRVSSVHKPTNISNTLVTKLQPPLPTMTVPSFIIENHDSPANSSVDEEQALSTKSLQETPAIPNQGEPLPLLINFEYALPSPFGRLDQGFPFHTL